MAEPGTEPKEAPVLETPAAPETPAVDHEANAKALLETLERVGMETPEKIQSVHYASQQAGRYANDLGDSRSEVEALRTEVNALKTAPPVQPQQYQQPYEGYDYNTPQPQAPQLTAQQVESIVAKQVTDGISKYTQSQLAATQAVQSEYAGIQSDPDYSLVQTVFDKHVSNPRVQLAIQSGQTSLTGEFNRSKVAFYKGMAMQSRDTMQGLLSQQRPAGVTPPHLEAGTTQVPGMPQPETHMGQLKEIHSKTTGTDDDLDAMLRTVLPDEDLFLHPPNEVKQGVVPRR